jgi:C_GCAxxG_C_C family probable redox protein
MMTVTAIEREKVIEMASTHFGNGFHCAEAVAAAVLAAMGEDPSEATAHATAFGGGVGETFEGDCGAISGALIAIGHLFGRRKPSGSWELAGELGAEIRQRFLSEHHTAQCVTLRERFGEQHQMAECRKLVVGVAQQLLSSLSERSGTIDAGCCHCSPD